MRKVVCVPWRGGQRDREDAWDRVRAQYERLGLEIVTGDSGHQRFHRAASRNAAAKNAGDWDVALFSDADVLLDPRNVPAALDAAYLLDVVVFPHDRYHRLDPRERVHLASTAPTNGGALALSREAWEYVGGYDERFAGWGYEDAAFRLATETLLGQPERIAGYMRELFHVKTGRGRSEAERVLYQRYKHAHAADDIEAMLALVREDPLR